MIDKDRVDDVLFAFVDNGNVATCFMQSTLEAFSYNAMLGERRRMGEYYNAPGPYIADNRARVARYFLECTNKQWLWMLDNDIKFPQDSLYRLLDAAEEHDVKILGAAYWNQYPGSYCYLSWLIFTPEHGLLAVPDLPPDRTAPVEVNAVGMGCTLIHRDVIQAVTDNYPNDPWDTFGQDILIQFADGESPQFLVGRSPDDFDQEMLRERPMEEMHRCGEDVTFCLRARSLGFVTYGLPSLEVEHYKPFFMPHGDKVYRPAEPAGLAK
jgi:hypothetical protein